MKEWQRLEDATVAQTAKIKMKTDNKLIRLVMEIIQRDSNMHHRIQQLIINSLEEEPVNIPVDDLVSIWDSIEQHIEMERKTVELGKVSLAELEGSGNVIQQYLLAFLMRDEEKHDKLLSDLELIKKGMFP
jgi:bacterioferritin (cytochrome b1)